MSSFTAYIWVDDLRPTPEGYYLTYNSVWEFIQNFVVDINNNQNIRNIVIDLDHDSGDYNKFGGDFINVLKYLEFYDCNSGWVEEHVSFKFHTANPVGLQNMKSICERNNWNIIE